MIPRAITEELKFLMSQYPVVTVIGPRQAGKTTLARNTYPDLNYVSLEDPDIRALAQSDARGFFSAYSCPLIIDEIQRVPELLSYIQTLVDSHNKKGQFLLTGSHQLALSEGVSQSLAGRSALLRLLPLSMVELKNAELTYAANEQMFQGFMPRIYSDQLEPTRFYRNYFETYVERDVRQLIQLKNLALFEKFLRLCAGRIGQIINFNGLGNEVGVDAKTIKHWLSILEASYIIVRLEPYFDNLNKRLVKSPKLFFVDVGLATYLLGIEKPDQIRRDPLRGALFENLVIVELMKARLNRGMDHNLYFYRDSAGLEIDVLYKRAHELQAIEIKSAETFHTGFLKNIHTFRKMLGERLTANHLIYAGDKHWTTHGVEVLNYHDAHRVVVA